MDGAGSYSVAHRAGLLPAELTGMWGWILLRSPHQGRGSPPAPAPTKQKPGWGWQRGILRGGTATGIRLQRPTPVAEPSTAVGCPPTPSSASRTSSAWVRLPWAAAHNRKRLGGDW